MTFVPFLALVFLVNKLVDWLRELVPDRLEPKLLIPLSWVAGAVVTYLWSLTVWAAQTGIGDLSLADLDLTAVILVGVLIGAGGSVLNDLKPNRLSNAQLDQVVDQADTVVLETPHPPSPAAKSRGTTKAKR